MKQVERIKLYAAVVIYNNKCEDSITCRALEKIKCENLEIIVADNSTEDYQNKAYCDTNAIHYLNMGGNVGLSKAYNGIIELISQQLNNGIIIWLDDDTEITQDYFDTLLRNVKEHPDTQIFAPIIYSKDDIIYSPNEAHFFKNKLIKNESQHISSERFNAINSCLAVRVAVYDKYRYDERLFMDQVDQKFCDDMRRKKVIFMKIKTKIVQNFFQRSKGLSVDSAWKRLEIRIKDMMSYSNGNIIMSIGGLIKVFGWGAQMGIKCRSVNLFLKCCVWGIKNFWLNFREEQLI